MCLFAMVNVYVCLCDVDDDSSIRALSTYCTDTRECTSTTISDTSVYCRGYFSCYQSTITASSLLWCSGDCACYGGTLKSSSGTIDCYGFQGCRGTTISVSSSGDISCNSRLTCYSATISGSSSSISCSGEHGCHGASITSSSTNCHGEYGCYSSDISASDTLNVSGYYSGAYSTITDTSLIYTHGYYGLINAYISSEDVDELNIYSDGDNSLYNTSLHCFDGSECNVYCDPGQSCNELLFYCYDGATCNLFCDDDCSSCPTIINVDDFVFGDKEYKNHVDRKEFQQLTMKSQLNLFDIGIDINHNGNGNGNGNSTRKLETLFDVKFGFMIFLVTIIVLFMAIYQLIGSLKNKDKTGHKYQQIF